MSQYFIPCLAVRPLGCFTFIRDQKTTNDISLSLSAHCWCKMVKDLFCLCLAGFKRQFSQESLLSLSLRKTTRSQSLSASEDMASASHFSNWKSAVFESHRWKAMHEPNRFNLVDTLDILNTSLGLHASVLGVFWVVLHQMAVTPPHFFPKYVQPFLPVVCCPILITKAFSLLRSQTQDAFWKNILKIWTNTYCN